MCSHTVLSEACFACFWVMWGSQPVRLPLGVQRCSQRGEYVGPQVTELLFFCFLFIVGPRGGFNCKVNGKDVDSPETKSWYVLAMSTYTYIHIGTSAEDESENVWNDARLGFKRTVLRVRQFFEWMHSGKQKESYMPAIRACENAGGQGSVWSSLRKKIVGFSGGCNNCSCFTVFFHRYS